MKIAAQTRWSALIEMAVGATVTYIACILLFFFTALGEDLPDAFKIGLPVSCWIAAIWFFLSHRSADGKSVNFKVW